MANTSSGTRPWLSAKASVYANTARSTGEKHSATCHPAIAWICSSRHAVVPRRLAVLAVHEQAARRPTRPASDPARAVSDRARAPAIGSRQTARMHGRTCRATGRTPSTSPQAFPQASLVSRNRVPFAEHHLVDAERPPCGRWPSSQSSETWRSRAIYANVANGAAVWGVHTRSSLSMCTPLSECTRSQAREFTWCRLSRRSVMALPQRWPPLHRRHGARRRRRSPRRGVRRCSCHHRSVKQRSAGSAWRSETITWRNVPTGRSQRYHEHRWATDTRWSGCVNASRRREIAQPVRPVVRGRASPDRLVRTRFPKHGYFACRGSSQRGRDRHAPRTCHTPRWEVQQ